MNHVVYYDFDNFDISLYECIPAVRNGTILRFLDCFVKFIISNEYRIIFWINGDDYTKEEAIKIFSKVSKILSYSFALPLYNKDFRYSEVNWNLHQNNLLSQKAANKIQKIENKINRFNKTSNIFEENLDLLVVAIDNFFKYRIEDAFVYYFKVIERTAKQYFVFYMNRHHIKVNTRKNKQDLKNYLQEYAFNNLNVVLTQDILDRKVDLLYKEIKKEFYGSIFGKISLFITKNNIDVNVDVISKLVKIRNKIAHGDIVDDQKLEEYLADCEYLAMQMFSVQHFNTKYELLHIKSYRYTKGEDVYGY